MRELIERLERATEPSRELDRLIEETLPDAFSGTLTNACPYYTESIDAALMLVEGKDWHIEMYDGCALAAIGERIDIAFEPHKIPAIALCIAALKARQSLSDDSAG